MLIHDWNATPKQMLRRELHETAGIPIRAIDQIEAGPKDTKALTSLAARKSISTVVLAGPPGVGKTIAACAWLAGRADKTTTPPTADHLRFVAATELARIDRYDQYLGKLLKLRAVVVDDLGSEYFDKNGYMQSFIDELISIRHSNCRETVITTNLNSDQFASRYGARVADRLSEPGCGFWWIGGDSLRKADAQ